MNRTQPIDAIYGGVINGIIKTISSQLCFASCVRASKNAVGTAMTVEHSTTHTPSSRYASATSCCASSLNRKSMNAYSRLGNSARMYGPTHSDSPTASGRWSALRMISGLKRPPLVSRLGKNGTWDGTTK